MHSQMSGSKRAKTSGRPKPGSGADEPCGGAPGDPEREPCPESRKSALEAKASPGAAAAEAKAEGSGGGGPSDPWQSFYVRFYQGTARAVDGETIDDVLSVLSDSQLNGGHRIVQAMWPNPIPSKAQPHADFHPFPPEVAHILANDPAIKVSVLKGIERMIGLWGLKWEQGVMKVVDEKAFKQRICHRHHSQLRMTRLIIFLKLLGWTDIVLGFKSVLEVQKINGEALDYWKKEWDGV